MRGRTIIIGGILAAAILLPDAGRCATFAAGRTRRYYATFPPRARPAQVTIPAPAIIARAAARPQPLPSLRTTASRESAGSLGIPSRMGWPSSLAERLRGHARIYILAQMTMHRGFAAMDSM